MRELASRLISFQSDKDHPLETKDCFEWVVSHLKKAGLKVKTFTSKGKLSLVAAREMKKHYRFILNGHLDVVPANYPQAFQPSVRQGRLYGRGAADMKGVVAAMIELIKDKQLGTKDLALMLSTDEEIGGRHGVDYLLNQENYSCDCAIVPDGGENWRLILTEKGVIRFHFQAEGKAAHSSRPWLGENALEKLILIYQTISQKIPRPSSKKNWLMTLNLGQLSGGEAPNQVPAKAEMFLDFRYPKNKQREKILKLVKKAVKKTTKVRFKIIVDRPVMQVAKKNQYLQRMMNVAKQEKIKLTPDRDYSASDGVYFTTKGIPVIMFKPECSQPHIDNEWINLKSLEKFSQILKTFLAS